MDVDSRQYEQLTVNDNDIHDIVLSYLVHNCYNETVKSFIASTGKKQPDDCLEDMDKRKRNEALEFAQTKLTPFGKVQKYVIKLEDFMALLAYEEPEKAPMFHLLSMEYRKQITTNLNRAILDHANKPSYSTMEKLIQQTTIVRQSLNQELGKDALSPFSLKDFLKS